MKQDLIYLTLEKDAGGNARLVDQHGRRLAGVRGVTMKSRYDDLTTLVVELMEKGPDGCNLMGHDGHLTRFDVSKPPIAYPHKKETFE